MGPAHCCCSAVSCRNEACGSWIAAQSLSQEKVNFISVSVDQVEQMLQWLWVGLEVVAILRLDSLLRV